MPNTEPPVLLLLLQREGPPQERHAAAWHDAVAQDAVPADVRHVWVGEGPVPAGMDLGSLGAAVPVLGVSPDTVAIVADAAAVPGPHVVRRLVDAVLEAPRHVVDARVLPVELTRTDRRPRGYGLAEGADPRAEVLDEAPPRLGAAGHRGRTAAPRDGGVLRPARRRPRRPRRGTPRPAGRGRPRLVEAAGEADLPVVVSATAAVSLPVRLGWDVGIEGLVTFPAERPEQWAGSSHPADLPATSLGALARQFSLSARPSGPRPTSIPDAPFLTHRHPHPGAAAAVPGGRADLPRRAE